MYQICVSGASKGKSVEEGRELAKMAGVALAKGGHALLTGATIGLPHYTAMAYKTANGQTSVGFSPASSKIEHVAKYRLPTDCYDVIIYTGMHYVGRDTFVVTSSDAVLSIGGRLGTLHEAVVAMETETPIAFLQGTGGTGSEVKTVLAAAGREEAEDIIFGDDPLELIKRLTTLLDKRNKKYSQLYD